MRFTANRDVAMGFKNLEKSSKFYEETIGLRLVEAGLGRAVCDVGHLTLYIREGEPYPPVLSLMVENLRAAKRQLLERGCDIVDERERSLSSGNRLASSSTPPSLHEERGFNCFCVTTSRT